MRASLRAVRFFFSSSCVRECRGEGLGLNPLLLESGALLLLILLLVADGEEVGLCGLSLLSPILPILLPG